MKRFFLVSLLHFCAILTFASVRINEVVSDNSSGYLDQFSEYPDWVELYNSGSEAVDLTGYYLSDKTTTPLKWVFPSVVIPANGYLVVYASSNNQVINGEIHTNFSISKSGEPVLLSDPTGTLLSSVNVPELGPDMSYALKPDLSWQITIPTKDALNVFQEVNFVAEPNTSLKAGLYPSPISVTYTCQFPTEKVVRVDFHDNVLEVIPTGIVSINQTTVLRMACQNENDILSDPKTDSYFIGETLALPIVSLSSNHDEMFGPNGIYTQYNNGQEILGHAEYFDKQGAEKFDLDLKLEIHGSISKMFPMKSFRMTANSAIGKPTIKGKVFEDRPYNEFKQLVLRNSGNDYNRLLYRDLLNSRIAKTTNVDWLAGQPVLTFVNGNFQGLYNLRERTNTDFVASVHGVDPNNVDFVDNNAMISYPGISNEFDEIRSGDNIHYQQLFSFIMNGNAQQVGGYNQVKQWIDIDNFIDYFALEIYHTNWDWPHNNVRLWRPRTTDGKWRFIYYDTDFGLALFHEDRTSFTKNELERVLNTTNSVHALVFKELMKISEFKCAFKDRLLYLMDHELSPANYVAEMQKLESEISSSIPRQHAKYTDQMACCRNQVVQWVNEFIQNRPVYMRQHIQSVLGTCVPEDTTIITNPTLCEQNLANVASNWTLRNDWNDGAGGSTISNTSEGIQVTHRSWGQSLFWLGYQIRTFNLQANKEYQLEFDFKDNASSLGVQNMEAVFTTGFNWNGPQTGQVSTFISGPFTKNTYSMKTAILKVNQSGQYFVAIKCNLGNQPSALTTYQLKNLKLCEVTNTSANLRVIPTQNISVHQLEVTETNQKSFSLSVYSMNGDVVYEKNGVGDQIILLDKSLNTGIYIAKLVSESGIVTQKFIQP